jgi:hypothetical protein
MRELQLYLETDANHRALRRCHACGSYTRAFREVNGSIRCDRCAEKASRESRDDREEDIGRKYLLG